MLKVILPPKRWFSQEAHGVTFQKTIFFKVIAVKTKNLNIRLNGWAL
jgi:hypothetical protein